MVNNRIIFLATRVQPNPDEIDYWVDLVENPYGGSIKYYNGVEWVKLFSSSGNGADLTNYYTKEQVNKLLNGKADTEDVDSKVDDDEIKDAIKDLVFRTSDPNSTSLILLKYDGSTEVVTIPVASSSTAGIVTSKDFNNFVKQHQLQELHTEMIDLFADIRAKYQKRLIAGKNIKIDPETNIISATGDISVEWDDVIDKPNFHEVAFSGDYNDLSNKLKAGKDVIISNDNTINVTVDLSDLQSDIQDLDAKIEAETNRAIKAEENNADAISANEDAISANAYAIAVNEAAININKAAIDANTTAISNNTTAINTEVARAKAEEAKLQSNITGAVTALENAIASEQNRATSAEEALDTKIQNEITRSTQQDTVHTDAIAKEVQDRKDAITKEVTDRNAAIKVESDRALAAEAALDTRIDTHTSETNASLALKADKSSVYTKEQVDAKISGAYKVKGSSTFEDLPTENQVVGDVYNITNAFTLNDNNYTAGTNVVWTDDGWDPLQGIFDATALETAIQEVEDAIAQETADRIASDNAIKADVADLDTRVATNTAIINTLTGNEGDTGSLADLIKDVKDYADTKVTEEKNRAESAEQQLAADLATEVTRAKGEESANATAIANEEARATTAEKALDDKIEALNTNVADNYVTLNTNQTITGAKTFSSYINLPYLCNFKYDRMFGITMTYHNGVSAKQDTHVDYCFGKVDGTESRIYADGYEFSSRSLHDLGSENAGYRWKNIYYEGQLNSYIATGTAPFVVKSTTKVDNLNADMLDGVHLCDKSNISGARYGVTQSYVRGNRNANAYYGNGNVVTFSNVLDDTNNELWLNVTVLSLGDDYNNNTQLAFSPSTDTIKYRRNTGSWNPWVTLLHTGNYTDIIGDISNIGDDYVKKSGDTMTGNLTVNDGIKVANPGGTFISQKTTDKAVVLDISNINNYKTLARITNTDSGNTLTLGALDSRFGFFGYKGDTTENKTDVRLIYDFDETKKYWEILSPLYIGTDATKAPLIVTSTTKVNNLNADMLDGWHKEDFPTMHNGSKTYRYTISNGDIDTAWKVLADIKFTSTTQPYQGAAINGECWLELSNHCTGKSKYYKFSAYVLADLVVNGNFIPTISSDYVGRNLNLLRLVKTGELTYQLLATLKHAFNFLHIQFTIKEFNSTITPATGTLVNATIDSPAAYIAAGTDLYHNESRMLYVTKDTYSLQQLDWYGVSWSETSSDPKCTRIGNMDMHRTLPILSAMKGFVIGNSMNSDQQYSTMPLKEDWSGTEYRTASNESWTLANNNSNNIMVRIPEFWYTDDYVGSTKTHNLKICAHAKPGWKHHKEAYVGAYEGYADTNGMYRSGPGLIPTVNKTRQVLRDMARENATDGSSRYNIYTYEEHRAICHLFLVEYATRNSQAAVNTALTIEGFRQGGLGEGCTTGTATINGAQTWSFVPTGSSNSLGNGSGEVTVTIQQTDSSGNNTSTITRKTNRYRGIENPFGHIWKHCDDVISTYANGRRTWYKCENPVEFETNKNNFYKHLATSTCTTVGYKTEIKATPNCDFFAEVASDGSATTYWCDYNWDNTDTTEHCLLIGGSSGDVSYAGLFHLDSAYGVGYSGGAVGSRLTYLPWSE